MANVFNRTAGLSIRRSVFDLTYEKKMSLQSAIIYPVMCDEMVPGDTFKVGASCVLRFNPLTIPVMHEVKVRAHYFFVPYRILDPNWEEIITGGIQGKSTKRTPRFAIPDTSTTFTNTLWDYLGFPTDLDIALVKALPDTALFPHDYPRRAYYCCIGEYYIDSDIAPKSFMNAANHYDPTLPNPRMNLFSAYYRKDYFTSARPFQQRGLAQALPISGSYNSRATFNGIITDGLNPSTGGASATALSIYSDPTAANQSAIGVGGVIHRSNTNSWTFGTDGSVSGATAAQLRDFLSRNVVPINFANAGTFDVSDLRTIFQTQKWMERNARSGSRYTEFLKAHFSVSPTDARLDRPEYVGGVTFPVVTSEVLQTSASADEPTPQANMAGHGISVGGDYVGSYTAKEYGLMMGLMYVAQKAAYEDRIDRQWLRRDRFEFYFPEFAHLSEQAINYGELRFTNTEAKNRTVFGFQGIFDEMRVKHDMVCGLFRASASANLSFWHMARHFNVAANAFNIVSSFADLGSGVNDFMRPFAVKTQPPMLLNWCNHIKAIRPIPTIASPGLVDHF
jgi:hypothetical protein